MVDPSTAQDLNRREAELTDRLSEERARYEKIQRDNQALLRGNKASLEAGEINQAEYEDRQRGAYRHISNTGEQHAARMGRLQRDLEAVRRARARETSFLEQQKAIKKKEFAADKEALLERSGLSEEEWRQSPASSKAKLARAYAVGTLRKTDPDAKPRTPQYKIMVDSRTINPGFQKKMEEARKRTETPPTTRTDPGGLTSASLYNIQSMRSPRAPAGVVLEYGGNISQEPVGARDSFWIRDTFLTPENTGGVVRAAEDPFKRVSSAQRSDVAAVARAKGDYTTAGKQEFLAASTGVFEFGRELVTNPVGFFVAPITHPRETLEGFKQGVRENPSGTFAQLATGFYLGGKVSKYFETRAANKAAAAKADTKAALSEAVTDGVEITYDDKGGYVQKRGLAQVNTGGQTYEINLYAADQFATTPNQGVVNPQAQIAQNIVRAETKAYKSSAGVVGQGQAGFVVEQGGKVKASGRVESTFGAVEFLKGEAFLRKTKGAVDIGGKVEPVEVLEVGRLQEAAQVKGPSNVFDIVTGKIDLYTAKGRSMIETTIKGVSKSEEGATPAFGDKVNTGETPVYDVVGGEPRTIKKTVFDTASTEKKYSPGEVSPLSPQNTLFESKKLSFLQRANQFFRRGEGKPGIQSYKDFVTETKDLTPEQIKVIKETEKVKEAEITTRAAENERIVNADSAKTTTERKQTAINYGPQRLGTEATKNLAAEAVGEIVFKEQPRPPPVASYSSKQRTPTTKEQPTLSASTPYSVRGGSAVTTTRGGEAFKIPTSNPRKVIFTEINAEKPTYEPVQRTPQRLGTPSAFKSGQEIRPTTREVSATESETEPVTVQRTGPEAVQRTPQAQRIAQRVAFQPVRVARPGFSFPTPYLAQLPRPPPPLRFSLGTTQQKKSFLVEVRKRGRFVPIARTKTAKTAALLGGATVQRTAAASLRISGGNALGFLPKSIFRASKTEPGVVVQRRGKRISSKGEKREITLKGLFSARRRRIL